MSPVRVSASRPAKNARGEITLHFVNYTSSAGRAKFEMPEFLVYGVARVMLAAEKPYRSVTLTWHGHLGSERTGWKRWKPVPRPGQALLYCIAETGA